MAELKFSSQSHKTGTFRGAARAEETIPPPPPLCHVTIMCNKDKWLAIKKKRKKACGAKLLLLARRQIMTTSGVPALRGSVPGRCRPRCFRSTTAAVETRAEESSQDENANVRSGVWRLLVLPTSSWLSSSYVFSQPRHSRACQGHIWWKHDEAAVYLSSSLPPFNLASPGFLFFFFFTSLSLSAGTAERRRGS